MADATKYNDYIADLKLELIVPIEHLMAASAFDLNIDENKLIFACVNAQKIYLEPLIGSALVRKLQENNLPFAYQVLLDRFLNDAILNWGAAESVRSIAYSLMNGGVYKHLPTDAEPVTAAELNTIRQDYLDKANQFANRCVDFLCKNSGEFPEYSQSVGDGLVAQKKALYTGGLLIEQLDCATTERVGPSDPNVFLAATYWGNNNETTPNFNPATLSSQEAVLPNCAILNGLSETIQK